LGITVERKGVVLNFINIYSPYSLAGKKKLWDELFAFKQQSGGGGSGAWVGTLMQFYVHRKEKARVRLVDKGR
jgi:hypothetical protein